MKLNLKSKNILITGSTEGIGLSIAHSFLKEGSNVCISSRRKKKTDYIKKKLSDKYEKSQILSFNCDFTNRSSVVSLRKRIIKKWNNIDVVVCNVGSGIGSKSYIPNSKNWNSSWKNNFESALISAQIFSKDLEKSSGSLVFISSIAGVEFINAPTEYSVAKSAVITLARNMSSKLEGKFRVNVIAPGNIIFEGGTWDKKIKEDNEQVYKMIKDKVPLGRFGKPEEVGNLCAFLCSNKSSFINGAVIVIDGGQSSSF